MGNDMWGADVEGLEGFGVALRQRGSELRDIWTIVRRSLYGTPWEGHDAQRARTDWDGTLRAQLNTVADDLVRLGGDLVAQAQDQRRASSAGAEGGGAVLAPGAWGREGYLLGGVLVPASPRMLGWFFRHLDEYESGQRELPPYLVKAIPALPWAVDEGGALLASAKQQSPEAQAAWWSGLSNQQRQALLFAYPGAVLALTGIPATDRAEATSQFARASATQTMVLSQEQVASADVRTTVDVGVEAKATIEQYGDGTSRVTLQLTGELGKSFGSGSAQAGVGVEAGVEVTYEFIDMDSARHFVENLRQRLDPDLMETFAGDDALSYLRGNEWARTSTELGLAVTGSASVNIGGAEAHLSGSVGGQIDVDKGTSTLYAEVAAGASFSSSGVSVGGDISAKIAFELDASNNVIGATFSGTISAEGSVSAAGAVEAWTGVALPADVASSTGAVAAFSASVDPSDPVTASLLSKLASDPSNATVLKALLERAEATVSLATTNSTSHALDLGVVKVSTSNTETTTTVVYAKPEGGSWVQVPVLR